MQRWQRVIGSVLTLGIIAFLAYRLDLPALRRALAEAQYVYVLPLLGTTLILYGVGALQWQLVLRPVQWVHPLRLFGAQMVAALAYGLLSLPVGGLVRAYVVARGEGASLSAVLATTLVDRLVDGFAFLSLVGIVLAFIDLPIGAAPVQAALRAAWWTSLGLYLGLAALLVVFGAFPAQGAAATIVEVVSHGTAMALGLVFLWLEGFTLDEFRALRARWQSSPF